MDCAAIRLFVILRLAVGSHTQKPPNLAAIRQALELAGIVFTGQPGDEMLGIAGKAREPQSRAAGMMETVKDRPRR